MAFVYAKTQIEHVRALADLSAVGSASFRARFDRHSQ
jgi:hypothetical protein